MGTSSTAYGRLEFCQLSHAYLNRTFFLLLTLLPFGITAGFQKGSVYDELVLLKRQSRHMTEERILHLMSGLCDAILALHSSTPPLAHR